LIIHHWQILVLFDSGIFLFGTLQTLSLLVVAYAFSKDTCRL